MPPHKDGPIRPAPCQPVVPMDQPSSRTDVLPAPTGRISAVVTPTASSTSQVVVINVNTLVTIPDFARFYHTTPDASFQPVYYALSDGSLVAPPLLDDLSATYISLIIIGCLLTVFARNIFASAAFIWSGKVRKKGLLYTLLASQLFAPAALIPLLVAQFQRAVSCDV